MESVKTDKASIPVTDNGQLISDETRQPECVVFFRITILCYNTWLTSADKLNKSIV